MTPLADILAADAKLAEEAREGYPFPEFKRRLLATRLDAYRGAVEIATAALEHVRIEEQGLILNGRVVPGYVSQSLHFSTSALAEIAAKLGGKE